ncbi:MAG: Holliday junction resolvase RuvX [Acidobacteria bacterium]|nr:Holliday junction resolvase RuvX [Acidobacteriota bacterium]
MRILGVDSGRRRIGLAVSDDSATLARPWQTIEAGATPAMSADRILTVIDLERRQTLDDFALGGIVVGLPRRLDGTDTHGTAGARALAAALGARTGLPVFLQDERLTSHEAESILARREPDWRERKKRVDAAAAAIVLQDYLDQQRAAASAREGTFE